MTRSKAQEKEPTIELCHCFSLLCYYIMSLSLCYFLYVMHYCYVLCVDVMMSLGVRFIPAGLDQQLSTAERSIRTTLSKVGGILNTLPYNLLVRWLMYLVQLAVFNIKCMSMRQSHGWYSPKEVRMLLSVVDNC